MNRRTFLATLGSLPALEAVPTLAAANEGTVRTTSNTPPRKVIVGTVMRSFWEEYPGLHQRLDQLAGIVDQMVAQAKQAYGRGLDLAILPETAISGEGAADAVPFEGEVKDVFIGKAREHSCYFVVPTYLLESEKKRCSNAAILVGRKGEVVGRGMRQGSRRPSASRGRLSGLLQ